MTTIFGTDITELRNLSTLSDVHNWFATRGFTRYDEEQDTIYAKETDAGTQLRFMVTNTTKVDYDNTDEHCVYLCTDTDDGKVDPLLAITVKWIEKL
jgi:hypothetical protein